MKFTLATRITLLRIFLIVPFVILMLNVNAPAANELQRNIFRYIATVIFLFMAISDGVDGYLARLKKQTTKLGAFLDPLADKLLMACTCLLLASERAHVGEFLLPPTVVVLIIGKDAFLLIGFLIIYFITFQVRIVPVLIGKVATTLQLSMAAGILVAPEISSFVPGWIWVLRILWWSAATTALLTALIYIINGSKYIEEYEQQLDEK